MANIDDQIKDLQEDISALRAELAALDAQAQASVPWQGDETQIILAGHALADQASHIEMHIEKIENKINDLEFAKSLQGLAANRKYQIWLNGGPLPEYQ